MWNIFYWKNGDLEQRFILKNCNETTFIAAVKKLFRKNSAMSNEDEDGEYYFYWKNGSLEQRFFDILDNFNETTVTAAITEIFRKKTRKSNEDEDGEYTFYRKNLALEKRFIDILKKCNEPTVIKAVKEIFLKKVKNDKASIENYLQYQQEFKELEGRFQGNQTNETSALAEHEKTELQKKINDIETVIKDKVKRFIPRTDSTDIEIIAAAMINHSEEVKEFIDFCSNKKIKRKQSGPEIPEVENTSIQTLQRNEDEILYRRLSPGAVDAENHTDQTQDKAHHEHDINILPFCMIVLNWICSFKKRLISLLSRLRQKLRTRD
ncbi:unnamed protein product [Mytilus coruscus]|uniref:Uncharacterized protein n=1 Tax=Mytilus coruscus TaxID=42192 RepID=A0A6J8AAL8_MYTCO|nr:unnamed protein product [Mytilus coruscus]